MSMTQKLSKRGAFLAASLVLGAALGVSSLSAQTVSTAPVGAVTTTVPVGLSALGYTLINADLVVASCASNTPTVVTLSGVSNVGSLLTASTPYYIEAVSGTLEGERFDVDTALTIAAGNSTVVLSSVVSVIPSNNNTTVLTADAAAGSRFALRKHVTLAQIQSMFTTPLVSNTNSGLADQIRLYRPSNGTFITYFLRTQTAWATGSTPSNNVVIAPGTGFFFNKVTAPATLVATGGVRLNAFSMPMTEGLALRSLGYPVSFSPALLGASGSTGWTFNSNSSNADQIRIFNRVNGTFTVNFARTTSAWASGSSTVTNTAFMPFDGGFFLNRKSADSLYIVPSPITAL